MAAMVPVSYCLRSSIAAQGSRAYSDRRHCFTFYRDHLFIYVKAEEVHDRKSFRGRSCGSSGSWRTLPRFQGQTQKHQSAVSKEQIDIGDEGREVGEQRHSSLPSATKRNRYSQWLGSPKHREVPG